MEIVSPIMAYKYIHVSSEDKVEQQPYTSHANIRVRIPEQIRNVRRCAVKSMGIGNTFFNVRDNINGSRSKLEWLEGIINQADEIVIKEYSIEIPEGYYTVDNVLNDRDERNDVFNDDDDTGINLILQEADRFENDHRLLDVDGVITPPLSTAQRTPKDGTTETELQISFVIDTVTDKLSATLQCDVEKFFMPIAKKGDHNLWKEWGFGSHTVKKYSGNIQDENNEARQALKAQMVAKQAGGFSSLTGVHMGVFNADIVQPIHVPPSATDGSVVYRALRVPTFENIKGFSICSDELSSGNSYETELFGEQNFAKRTNILEWVSNPVPQNTYIQHEPNMLHWHICNKAILNDFDIQIKDVDGRILSKNSLPHYYLVLVLEVEDHAYSQDYIKQFNRESYRLGHPTSMFG